MRIISSTKKLGIFLASFRAEKSIGFVPTMGFLHEGHLSLVRRSKRENDLTVVSIYVNPLQFGPREDFKSYPRDIKRDAALLRKEGVDILFAPTDEEIYPAWKKISPPRREAVKENFPIFKPPERLSNCLCGLSRPGHFDGVATALCIFFNIIKPQRAYFGQKDYQQFLIVRNMAESLHSDVKILMSPTVRESDGLAKSSRNVYLKKNQRKSATFLYKALREVAKRLKKGLAAEKALAFGKKILEADKLISIDYLDVRDSETLAEVNFLKAGDKAGAFGAVRIGKTRIIDNVLFRYHAIIKLDSVVARRQ